MPIEMLGPLYSSVQAVFSAFSIFVRVIMLIPTPCLILVVFAIGCLVIRILF